METLIAETVLPNGMKIFCLREDEVLTLYEQIQDYFKNGIELHEGDTVLDVGANIGLFTLWSYQQCHKNVTVYAFEPIPAIFDVLSRNAQRFDPEKLRVFPCGVWRETKMMKFAYHPNATPLSNAYPQDSQELRDQLKEAVLRNLRYAPPYIRWLRWFPSFLRSFILDIQVKKAFQTEQITCQMKTISDIVRENDIQQIDLLKVDVEKSELDVLLGIEEDDWQKVKQVVVEVHDLEDRVKQITALLKAHGLTEITVEQENLFQGSNLFNLYALRSS